MFTNNLGPAYSRGLEKHAVGIGLSFRFVSLKIPSKETEYPGSFLLVCVLQWTSWVIVFPRYLLLIAAPNVRCEAGKMFARYSDD